jgi:hypothetical protein
VRDGRDADTTGAVERAALRAYLGALAEVVRGATELEGLCDFLQGQERLDQIEEIFGRLEHVHQVLGDLRRR